MQRLHSETPLSPDLAEQEVSHLDENPNENENIKAVTKDLNDMVAKRQELTDIMDSLK